MKDIKSSGTTSFHLQLLLKIIDIKQYPLTKVIIEHGLTNEEYVDLFDLLHTLDEQFEIQKAEGLMDFTSLLIHFAGMLHEKLDPTEIIYAIYKEGYFPLLMKEFITIIEKEQKKDGFI